MALRCGAPNSSAGGHCRQKLVKGACPHHGTQAAAPAPAEAEVGASAGHDPLEQDAAPGRERSPRGAFSQHPKKTWKVDWDRLEHLRGRNLVTIDMDGTLYDPWACCGNRGHGYSSSPSCTHMRHDILEQIRDACEQHDAIPVALSWRGGLVETTVDWLADCEVSYRDDPQAADGQLELGAMFLPGANDDVHEGSRKLVNDKHTPLVDKQVEFKVGTIRRLEDELGCTVVSAFEDNPTVIGSIADHGVAEAVQVPRKVAIAKHEWAAGYLGAPDPKVEPKKVVDAVNRANSVLNEVARSVSSRVRRGHSTAEVVAANRVRMAELRRAHGELKRHGQSDPRYAAAAAKLDHEVKTLLGAVAAPGGPVRVAEPSMVVLDKPPATSA